MKFLRIHIDFIHELYFYSVHEGCKEGGLVCQYKLHVVFSVRPDDEVQQDGDLL